MKILIVTNHMRVGGIQKSLLELLKTLSKNNEYDVSLFCCKKTGAFLELVPNNIKILPENPYAIATEQSLSECKQQGIKYYIFRMIMSLWSKCFTKALPSSVFCKLFGKIDEKYDVAISYSQPIEDHQFCNLTNEIVLNCTTAEKKITFVHCDFGSYGGNTKRNRKLYKKFDRIAAVSKSVAKRFAEIVPDVSEKLQTVYNFCDCNEIERLAAKNPLIYTKKTIVTVARLSEEKGILRCIPIFSRLKSCGLDFEWRIVGDGPMRNAIEEEITRHSLNENIILDGEQLNPYRFVKNADYFLLPSYHEAAPIVFDEAFTLGVPVLTTNTLSAVEMIEKRGIGIVCENNDEAIYDMLYRILSSNEKFHVNNKPNNKVCMEQFDSLCSKY
ncbi:MAG: glycosyltransferase [Clostridia bacterium]|nr:glycosyltransferase [Clostridia bacterium]